MKPLLVLWLALGGLPIAAGTRQTPVAPIVLYTQFQEEPPEAVIEALEGELESIMRPMGIRFEWRSLTGARSNEAAVELAVLTFRGRCDAGGLLPRNSAHGALGWTHMSDGIILPFSEVDCDRIRTFVQKDLLLFHPSGREAALGRALGRVVAHELYHIFADTARHGSDGVGKAAYTVEELLSGDFQFEERESLALRESKAHQLLEHATRAPTLD